MSPKVAQPRKLKALQLRSMDRDEMGEQHLSISPLNGNSLDSWCIKKAFRCKTVTSRTGFICAPQRAVCCNAVLRFIQAGVVRLDQSSGYSYFRG
jgi:hypothetical protein